MIWDGAILWQNWDRIEWLSMTYISCFFFSFCLFFFFQFLPFLVLNLLLSAFPDLFCTRGMWEEKLICPLVVVLNSGSCEYHEGGQVGRALPESDFIFPGCVGIYESLRTKWSLHFLPHIYLNIILKNSVWFWTF